MVNKVRSICSYTNENVGYNKIPDITFGRSSMNSQYIDISRNNLRHNNIQSYIVTYMWKRTA